MSAPALLAALDQPRWVQLSRATWEAVAILAGLRVAVNDRFRTQRRDRGELKNPLADTWGLIGELVALRALNSITAGAIEHCPIDFDRPVDAVDLLVDCGPGAADDRMRLEAKAHLFEDGKRYFLVNQEARDNSEARGAFGYIPVVSVLGAGRALVGRLIPLEELHAWPRPPIRLDDPAVGQLLTEFAPRFLGRSLGQVVREVGNARVVTQAHFDEVLASGRRDLTQWQERLPNLDQLTAVEVVAAVQAQL